MRFRGLDTMSLASKVVEAYITFKPDAVFVDGGGVGGGVVDRLRQLRVPCIEVQFGSKSDNNFGASETNIYYANKRAEMWGSVKEWLRGGAIHDDPQLVTELAGPEYGFVQREGREAILLESKDSMRKRGVASPDLADALALTFAYPVVAKLRSDERPDSLVVTEYDPFTIVEAPGVGDFGRFYELGAA